MPIYDNRIQETDNREDQEAGQETDKQGPSVVLPEPGIVFCKRQEF